MLFKSKNLPDDKGSLKIMLQCKPIEKLFTCSKEKLQTRKTIPYFSVYYLGWTIPWSIIIATRILELGLDSILS